MYGSTVSVVKTRKPRPIPAGSTLHSFNEKSGVEVFINKELNTAIAFTGKQSKSTFYYRYNDTNAMLEYVNNWFEKKEKEYEEKKNEATIIDLKVGDVLRSSWGYEQTNIDFYKVVKMVGKKSVSIVKIGGIRTTSENNFMTGTTIPNPDEIIGKPFTKRVQYKNGVSINSYKTANKMIPNEDGTYNSSFWSSYN